MARINKWRVYVQPFDRFGAYTGEWIEVTSHCSLEDLGAIAFQLDNTDYNIGIYRNSNFQVTFRNDDGMFSDVGQPGSIFQWTRTNSLFKITYTPEEFAESDGVVCGFFIAGNTFLSQETELFRGFLSDKAMTMDLEDQKLTFDVLGLEQILTQVPVNMAKLFLAPSSIESVNTGTPGTFHVVGPSFGGPYFGQPVQFQVSDGGSLPVGVNASNYDVDPGDDAGTTQATTYYGVNFTPSGDGFDFSISSQPDGSSPIEFDDAGSGTMTYLTFGGFSTLGNVLFGLLNRSEIKAVLDIEFTNVNVGQDCIIDDMSDLVGKNTWDAVSDLLLITNSVLYIRGTTLFVSPRTASIDVKYTFYGQASIGGLDNIQDIQNITNGLPRMFNYFVWKASQSVLPPTLQLEGSMISDTPNSTTQIALQNAISITKYGASVASFNQKYVVNVANWETLFGSLLDEFGNPKQEFDLYTPIVPETLALTLLDRVEIDYPAVSVASIRGPLPICGQAVCGEAVLPASTNFAFVETTSNPYKIEGVSIDPATDLVCLSMRRI